LSEIKGFARKWTIISVASEYGRYGYRQITALLREAGWHVGNDRVQRIWGRDGAPRLPAVVTSPDNLFLG
jgi:transposase InsO family protein